MGLDPYLDKSFAQYFKSYPLTLIDVGAGGGFPERWKRAQRYLYAIGFEPDRREFDKLIQYPKLGFQHKYLDVVLYKEEREIDLHLLQKQDTSSILLPNYPLLSRFPMAERFKHVKSIKLKADTLDHQLAENQISDVDFLKLDTQGSELFILEGALKTLKGPSIGLEMELEFVPIYRDQPLFCDVHQFVQKFGFELFDLAPVYWKRKIGQDSGDRKGQLIYVDALYLKPFERLFAVEQLSSEPEYGKAKVLKALSISLIYGYVDYTLELLEQAGAAKILSTSEKDLISRRISEPWRKQWQLPSFRGRGRIERFLGLLNRLFTKRSPWSWIAADSELGNKS
jgi:FkbM family methyltransferase